MFDVGGGELLLIVLAILVLFGPKKIPEVATMVGKGMRKVRQAQDEFTQHLRDISTEMEQAGDTKSVVNTLPEAEVVEFVSAESTEPENSDTSPQQLLSEAHDSSPEDLVSGTAAKPTIQIIPSQGSVAR